MGLYLAAYFGVETVVQLLLDKAAEADSKDNNSRTPLSWAAKNGYKAVVKFLLETSKIEADSKDSEG
jgi:ankyrin repeat protein